MSCVDTVYYICNNYQHQFRNNAGADMYKQHKALMVKLESAKSNLRNPLRDLANFLIKKFDESGYLSEYEVGTVNDLLERAK
jgi:hypothetical protein